ncbi:hypothetical protein Dimus_021633, partial [Dionaea muscipula]
MGEVASAQPSRAHPAFLHTGVPSIWSATFRSSPPISAIGCFVRSISPVTSVIKSVPTVNEIGSPI